eukprot:1532562-Pleurochrysis_carterae.AAC.1
MMLCDYWVYILRKGRANLNLKFEADRLAVVLKRDLLQLGARPARAPGEAIDNVPSLCRGEANSQIDNDIKGVNTNTVTDVSGQTRVQGVVRVGQDMAPIS